MTKLSRASLYATPILLILLLNLLWTQLLKPLAINLITAQIPKINSAQDILTLKVNKIDLSILKLQLLADGLQVEFKKNSELLTPFVANKVSVQLDIFDLIVGHLNIAKLTFEDVRWSYDLKFKSSEKKIILPVEMLFKYTNMIPIDRLVIYNSEIQLTTIAPQTQIKLRVPLISLSNYKKYLALSVVQLNAEISQNKKNSFMAQAEIETSINANELQLNKFQIRTLDSEVSLTAKFENIENLVTAPQGQIKFNSQLKLQDLRSILLLLFPQKQRLPAIAGFIETSGNLNIETYDRINGAIDISTSQVILEQFKLGQAQIKATIKNNLTEISEIKLEHPAGFASLKNVKIENNAPYKYTAAIEIDKFNLQKLFMTIGLTAVPAGFLADGTATCSGAWQANLIATCKVHTVIENIWVKPTKTDTLHIVKLKQVRLNGEAQFSKQSFRYVTDVQIGSSTGKSSGQVDFKSGFDFNFETPSLNFDDVESLADLNIKGQLKIKGSTQGDSQSGIINANISMNNTVINDFYLGHLNAALEYKNANLKFNQLAGVIGKSDINGFLHLNFTDSSLDGNLNSSNLNGEDVFYILNKKFHLPFEFSGAGKAQVVFNGPFNFWKLKYDLKSEFNNGSLAKENYRHFYFNLFANGDSILFKKVRLEKIKSTALLEGSINTASDEPQFNLKIDINPFLLEEINHLTTYAPAILGIGYSSGQILGSLSSPKINTNFTLKQVTYDKVDYPNSQGQLIIDEKNLNLNGQFFGRQIQFDIVWPWNVQNRFAAKILVHDLNPLFLLPLISIPQPTSEYSSKLNMEIDLTSKNRSLALAEGSIKFIDFSLERGLQFVKLVKPSRLIFNSGLSQMEPIVLQGPDSYLSFNLDQKSKPHSRLNITANLELKLLHFIVPFTHTLSGNLVVDSQILLNSNGFEMLGTGELTDGTVSFKGFPQIIESINTPLEFSKSKIYLTDITGKLGQSDVTGLGQINILGPQNVQVNLRAVADNVELNFPDKILTAGRANLLFTGNWLPYNLKIDYNVFHGLVEKNFESESGRASPLQASPFLPPKHIEQLSPSLYLDINIDISKGILIKNNLIEGEANGSLNISGSPESPKIKGKINIKSGSKLFFKDKPFTIQTALINFQDSKEINPDLYISSSARINDYDINLLVQGPAKNPSIKPTSQPPLSESDLFSLLALGVTSQANQNLSSDTQQKQTGLEVLAAISNQSQLNKKIQNKLGLSLQLAPTIDSTKNIAVPKVVVSKKLSEKFNASYSKPFTGNDQNQEIRLQYLYNNSVSFLLNYQNKDFAGQDQTSVTNINTKSIWGLDLEYRDEFK